MKASTRATTTKSGSSWVSLQAAIFLQNSSILANSYFYEDPKREFLFGKTLSSKQTPPIDLYSSFLINLRALL